MSEAPTCPSYGKPRAVLRSRVGSSLCKGWQSCESTPKPPSRNSGEHLREDTVYLAEFIWGIINKLPALYCGKWVLPHRENGFSLLQRNCSL